MTLGSQVLTGAALEEGLDRLEADFEESGDAAQLLEALRSRPLCADSLEAIDRLHTLWMRAGDSEAARSVVGDDGAALLASVSAEEKPQTAAHLAYLRLQIAEYLDDADAMLAALAELRTLMQEAELDASALQAYKVLGRLLRNTHLEVALQAAEWMRTLSGAIPGRAAFRACDAAVCHARRALAYAREKDADKAEAAARDVVAALKSAGNDQDVDADDWLRLADYVIDVAPSLLPDFQAALAAFIDGWPLPLSREKEVRLARLKARALHAQGKLEDALEAAQAGHYALNSYGADDFIEYELPWLLEAGRLDDAGERAFLYLYQIEAIENEDQLVKVLRIIHARLADPADSSVWWPLCVMRACFHPVTLRDLMHTAPSAHWTEISETHRKIFSSLSPSENFEWDELCEARFDPVFIAARAIAEARAPGHPWIRRLAAVQDHAHGRMSIEEQIAALESSVRDGLEDDRTANTLMLAYLAAFGVEKALKQPLSALPSGLWTFNFVTNSEDYLEEAIDALPMKRQEAAWSDLMEMKRKYYEQGLARMERFYETGEGHPYDASVHLYSMMLCNLAIVLQRQGHTTDALELARRGIALDPFMELYDVIFTCHTRLEDRANIVKAAEDLWNCAAESDASRFDPEECARFSAEALSFLGRAQEIPIWLERLTQWERQNDIEESELPENHLYARLVVLFYMTDFDEYKEAVLDAWRRIEAQVRENEAGRFDDFSGDLMRSLELFEDAIFFYERSDAIKGTSERREEFKARCRDEITKRAGKRWWKVWK
ncbi:MAG: hypothetical protein LBL72_01080 [Candidatus Accumulibacter sp.]|jgi:hypothetical protein|nr:hypothetical protein [Accumulibacter sp.]